MRRDSLAHLSDRVRRGDLAAFEELFRAMHAPLCEVADSYVQSQAIAEEIVQDLFFAIWMKRDRLPNVDSLQAYLFTAARNRSLHHLRHRAKIGNRRSYLQVFQALFRTRTGDPLLTMAPGGNRGHAREAAGTKAAQEEGIASGGVVGCAR